MLRQKWQLRNKSEKDEQSKEGKIIIKNCTCGNFKKKSYVQQCSCRCKSRRTLAIVSLYKYATRINVIQINSAICLRWVMSTINGLLDYTNKQEGKVTKPQSMMNKMNRSVKCSGHQVRFADSSSQLEKEPTTQAANDGLLIISIADWKLVAAVPINHLRSVSVKRTIDRCSNQEPQQHHSLCLHKELVSHGTWCSAPFTFTVQHAPWE